MAIYPTLIEVENFGPFRGKHSLRLTDSVYAVLAVHELDPERSNWQGKSTLLWTVPYALFGVHMAKADNDCVTYGEKQSMVSLHLSDGTVIERSKALNKSTQLEVWVGGKTNPVLRQSAGQEAIVRRVGMSKDDFMATCFFEQKQLARLVSARSAERIEMVESWLAEDLEPIQDMHALAQSDLVRATARAEAVASEQARIESEIQALVLDQGFDVTVPPKTHFDRAIVEAEKSVSQARTSLDNAKQARLAAESWAAKVDAATEFERIATEGEQLRSLFDSCPPDIADQADMARDKVAVLKVWHTEAVASCTEGRALASGKFNGTCPVTKSPCPSAQWVATQGLPANEVERREQALARVVADLNRATISSRQLAEQAAKQAQLGGKLQALRGRAASLLEAVNEVAEATSAPNLAALDGAVAGAERDWAMCQTRLRDVKTWQEWLAMGEAHLKKLGEDLAEVSSRRALYSEAVQLLGKSGAQQRLGEIALANVEAGANSLLLSAGIDLTVKVSWVTHLQGQAKHCEQCGTAYPSSAKSKQCVRCGATRGSNVSAKLVIELSNRSGAAEDLAGIAVGLAASQWLRHKRASEWSSVFIDEPFGALDAHNKRALSVHVSTLLRRSFASAFVVAHDKSILDALPSRVTIVGSSNGSRIT